MVRPRKNYCISVDPKIDYFKLRGIPLTKLEKICLTIEGRKP